MEFHDFLERYGWIVAIGCLVVGTFILQLIIRAVGNLLHRRLSRVKGARGVVAATCPKAAIAPAVVLAWMLVIVFVLEIVFRQWVGFEHPIPLLKARKLAILVAVAWWLFRWKRLAQRRLHAYVTNGQVEMEITQIDLVGKLVTLVLFVFVVLLFMQVAGLDMKALVTLSGFGAVALGLAGKDVFSNLFSGVMIYITKPFGVGDTISSSNGIEGVVEQIGWYLTQLRAVDKRPAYVPNALFSSQVVINTSRMTNRRIEFKLGVRYEDMPLIEPIVVDIREALKQHTGVDQKLKPTVWFTDYGSSSVNIFVRCYTKSTDFFSFLSLQQEVLLRCGEIVHKRGADFAFPTTTIDLPPRAILVEQAR